MQPRPNPLLRRASVAAFTMVEIALSLAIVAFALVAIIGVLPTGLRVQKDNREETIIVNDGLYLLEAIRSGSRGLNELTNYFDLITVSNRSGSQGAVMNYLSDPQFKDRIGNQPVQPLTNGWQVVGLLSTPKFEWWNGVLRSNRVTAHVRAINGSAVEKDPANKDFGFKYLLGVEMLSLNVLPPDLTNFAAPNLNPLQARERKNNWRQAMNIASNFNELRLTIQWPLFQKGKTWDTGNNIRTFRTVVGGRLWTTNILNSRYYFIEPGSFAQARLAIP